MRRQMLAALVALLSLLATTGLAGAAGAPRPARRDRGVESFVPHRIAPAWLRSLTKVEDPPEFRN